MKSFYSIALVTAFAFLMSVLVVIQAATAKSDLSTTSAAIIALTAGMAMIAVRLAQAEKRIARLENQIEETHKEAIDKKTNTK